jgi:ubiquinone biosynthesis protein
MRRRVRLLLRLLQIQRTFMRHGLDELVWRTRLFPALAWLQRLRPWRARPAEPLAVRLRSAIEELGPIFVKFGQAVSVRPDLLPRDVASELAKLQDRVPPFDSALAVASIEKAFGQPIDAIYSRFERAPLAAASIAQVHAAQLPSGEDVVVKLLRPAVRERINRDLDVLYALADLAEAYWEEADRLHPGEVVQEFERTLLHELDLMREGGNAAQLRRNFHDSDMLYVPNVYWDYCRSNVLTLERIDGIPIGDTERLRSSGANIKRLAENGVQIFFTQVFRHNFFHADMHPGNIFIDVTDPANPKYVAVDFGIVGSLSASDQLYLAENFLAFFRRDYRRVAKLHVDSGWVPAETRIDELEAAIRTVCEPIFDKPLKDISFGLVLMRLFETAREFKMEVQPQLVLLEKTLLAIEGLGRQLYPELDLWRTAYPILEEWMKQRRDPLVQLRRLAREWPEFSEDLMLLPDLIHRAVRQAREPASMRAGPPTLGEPRRRPPRLWLPATLILAGVLLIGARFEPAWVGWIVVAAGLILLPWRAR